MLRIDKSSNKLVRLTDSALSQADHWERHLQEMIWASPDEFSAEIDESLWLIGREVRPSQSVPDRIDLLAVDESGNAVVIELKRGRHKLQLMQAVSYAGMVSRWSPSDFVRTLSEHYNQTSDAARADIEEHTGDDLSKLNGGQRVLLVAEDFDPAVLIAAEWLHESFGVDIKCYRIQLSRENEQDYLTCTCIYPPTEIATLTRRADGTAVDASAQWSDWDAVLQATESIAVREFFRAELDQKRENRLTYREVIFRIGSKRRFWVASRKDFAYVTQRGRFEGDKEFWVKTISKPASMAERGNGRALRFHLVTSNDFLAFKQAVTSELVKIPFSEVPEQGESPIDEE